LTAISSDFLNNFNVIFLIESDNVTIRHRPAKPVFDEARLLIDEDVSLNVPPFSLRLFNRWPTCRFQEIPTVGRLTADRVSS
jgi:hypothetical protein